MPTLFITGANRGLGLEFVRQYRAKGWDVIATVRERSDELDQLGAEVRTLDLGDLDRVAAAFVAQVGTPGRRRPGHRTGPHGDRLRGDELSRRPARIGGRERYRPLTRRVNGAERGAVGHGRHGGASRSTGD